MARFALHSALLLTALTLGPASAQAGRRVVSLNGDWQVAEGSMAAQPAAFTHQVPVPGLIDMARPAFADVGNERSDRHRQAFWYRRTFTVDGPAADVAILKLHKACYGTQVYLNGKLLGEHLPCFTPVEYDVTRGLRPAGKVNELVVRLGAWRMSIPRSIPDGFDFEKVLYIPGIYDEVELILTGTPRVQRVQAVPELETKTVQAVVWLEGKPAAATRVTAIVREAKSGKEVGRGQADAVAFDAQGAAKLSLRVPVAGCRLWSPEDPFLYELEVATPADTLPVRFGMRSFRLDQQTGRAMLNGKPYFMRGTNVCIYRFFEDPARGRLPWNDDWVRNLHRLFRNMHWNSIRYCIGFPPERWYRIADEEGLLIQDEFPIWFGGDAWPAELKADQITREYTEWMRERWNHPCVVIWDAQNETLSPEPDKAIAAVRGLDLSGRPWDDGYNKPARPGDVFEAHPYAFSDHKSRLSKFAKLAPAPGVPGGLRGSMRDNTTHNPVIINEYGWLWLNRDGSVCTLTKRYYRAVLGINDTEAQRRDLYARMLAAKTEFWRSHRAVAGVLHFCGLGYSRAGGETSDHFLDVAGLKLDPLFEKLVGDSFAPVGLMIDLWFEQLKPGQKLDLGVPVINDLERDWLGAVRLSLRAGNKVLWQSTQACRVPALGRATPRFAVAVPTATGEYRLLAELLTPGQPTVESVRQFNVKD